MHCSLCEAPRAGFACIAIYIQNICIRNKHIVIHVHWAHACWFKQETDCNWLRSCRSLYRQLASCFCEQLQHYKMHNKNHTTAASKDNTISSDYNSVFMYVSCERCQSDALIKLKRCSEDIASKLKCCYITLLKQFYSTSDFHFKMSTRSRYCKQVILQLFRVEYYLQCKRRYKTIPTSLYSFIISQPCVCTNAIAFAREMESLQFRRIEE